MKNNEAPIDLDARIKQVRKNCTVIAKRHNVASEPDARGRRRTRKELEELDATFRTDLYYVLEELQYAWTLIANLAHGRAAVIPPKLPDAANRVEIVSEGQAQREIAARSTIARVLKGRS